MGFISDSSSLKNKLLEKLSLLVNISLDLLMFPNLPLWPQPESLRKIREG